MTFKEQQSILETQVMKQLLSSEGQQRLSKRTGIPIGTVQPFVFHMRALLKSAPKYMVTEDFMALTQDHMSDLTMHPYILEAQSFFTLTGVMYFRKALFWPWTSTDGSDHDAESLVAVTWELHPGNTASVTTILFTENDARFRNAKYGDNSAGFTPTSTIGHNFEVTFGKENQWLKFSENDEHCGPDNFAIATLLLINERLATVKPLPRPKKEGHRKRRFKSYFILDLRRPESCSVARGGYVDWQQRWLVRGHWRNQKTNNGIKPTWIAPYIKGPDDKPFIPKERLIRAVR